MHAIKKQKGNLKTNLSKTDEVKITEKILKPYRDGSNASIKSIELAQQIHLLFISRFMTFYILFLRKKIATETRTTIIPPMDIMPVGVSQKALFHSITTSLELSSIVVRS